MAVTVNSFDATIDPVIILVEGGVTEVMYTPPFVKVYIIDQDEQRLNEEELTNKINEILKSHGVREQYEYE